jgi:crossover junction endodeoxyribonuclease RuvC
MIVIGIDPGTATTGYGVVEKTNGKLVCLDYGTIATKPSESAPERLKIIYGAFDALLEKYHPDYAITERLFFSANATTGIPVGRALGVILLAIAQRSIPWTEYTPTQVKNAVVGVGNADKKQVQFMVTRILNLRETPQPDDAADALAIAICHAHTIRPTAIVKPPVRG